MGFEIRVPTGADLAPTVPRTMGRRRGRLTRDRLLRVAVALADESGIEALSMRHLADELGVVPMALYKHVANKEALLDGMVDVVVGEIDPPAAGDWRSALRGRVLSARRSLQRHPWAPGVIESRTSASPATLAYIDSTIATLRAGGFSPALVHHALHTIGSRLYGFTRDVLDDSPDPDPAAQAAVVRDVVARYPHIAEMVAAAFHDRASMVGRGCDDQFEFEFALDLLLDGLERLRAREASAAH